MLGLKKGAVVLAALGTLMFLAAPAVADWDEGDMHKMHFPQLPDPNGWDVAWYGNWLGDDWVCSKTGPVSDIHLWVSYYGYNDDVPPSVMTNANLAVRIYTNNPCGPDDYSIPDVMKWERTFTLGDYTICYAGYGEQQWYWPTSGVVDPDGYHTSYFQINIDEITNPFHQVEDEVYWLVTKFDRIAPEIGWKTADLTKYPHDYPGHTYGEHFMDDAVLYHEGWNEISIAGASRDLAFVITPEPGTLVLLATAGLGLLLFAWRKRK